MVGLNVRLPTIAQMTVNEQKTSFILLPTIAKPNVSGCTGNQLVTLKIKYMKEQMLFVDKDTFSNFQKMVMEKGVSQTKNKENPLKFTDNFLEYTGINIWGNETIILKLHIYTKKL